MYPMSSSSFFAGVERALSFMTRRTCEDDRGVATVSEGVSNGGGWNEETPSSLDMGGWVRAR